MALFDLVGRRWVLRIIWEMHHAPAPLTFRVLRVACGEISSSVLTRRLSDLTAAKLVASTRAGYVLTATGQGLVASLEPLLEWSKYWAQERGH